jgi:hypothetical protein
MNPISNFAETIGANPERQKNYISKPDEKAHICKPFEETQAF